MTLVMTLVVVVTVEEEEEEDDNEALRDRNKRLEKNGFSPGLTFTEVGRLIHD